MKKTFVAILLLILLSEAFGQEIKFFGGANWARYSKPPDMIKIPELSFALRYNTGLVFGIGFEIPFSTSFSLDVSGQYFQKGTTVKWVYMNHYIGGVSSSIYALNVIGVPVCAKVRLFARPSLYIAAGGEVSYVLSNGRTDIGPFPSPWRTDLINHTRRLDFGLVAGGGANLIFRSCVAFLELRYHAGLVNLSKGIEDYPIMKTRALALLAGIKIVLTK